MIFGRTYIEILYVIPVVVISIVLHEMAHGYVALWNGDPTAKQNGRLTLNPIAHFDIFGFLMMVMMGFGYAKPVPVNPNNFRHLRRGIFTVSIAGVVVNLGLAFVSMPFYYLFTTVLKVPIVATFFFYMVIINGSLIVFNLLPIYPLDGFRIIESFTSYNNKYVRFMRNYGFFILIGFLILGVFVDLMLKYGAPSWLNYFDILGYWLAQVREWILWPLDMFWRLIFGLV